MIFAILLALSNAIYPAQTAAPAPSLQFEVASIKPTDPTSGARHRVGIDVYPGGRVTITTFSLQALICAAFNVKSWQVKGGEAWTEKLKLSRSQTRRNRFAHCLQPASLGFDHLRRATAANAPEPSDRPLPAKVPS